MPMIDVYAKAGTFRDTKALARDLAAAVMRWEGVPEIPLFKDNTAASPGAVVLSKGAFGAAGNWVAAALELRTVAGGAPPPLLGNLFVGPIGFGR